MSANADAGDRGRGAERIGFIGLGIMGRPMARRLLDAGHHLTVHSRSPGPVDELVDAGAERAGSGAEVAAASDVVITMLPDTPDVEAVLFGEDGVAAGSRGGSLVIDMSTVSPVATRRFAERLSGRELRFLDAPVSGGETGAVEGTLSIMVGGGEDDFARARPLFEAMGGNIVLVGGVGAGQVTKACNQLVVAATIEAVAEALVLAASSGVDPAKVREALLGGFAGSKILEVHGKRMLDGAFDPGFRIRLHRKDAGIILETAHELGSPLPGFEAVADALERAVKEGGAELDHSALVRPLEAEAGVEVRAEQA
jgi:2-hydroxy-3-oxopropionate reductase